MAQGASRCPGGGAESLPVTTERGSVLSRSSGGGFPVGAGARPRAGRPGGVGSSRPGVHRAPSSVRRRRFGTACTHTVHQHPNDRERTRFGFPCTRHDLVPAPNHVQPDRFGTPTLKYRVPPPNRAWRTGFGAASRSEGRSGTTAHRRARPRTGGHDRAPAGTTAHQRAGPSPATRDRVSRPACR
jgi:hypothetical protein